MLQLVAIVIFESFQLQFRMASACHQPGVILELPKMSGVLHSAQWCDDLCPWHASFCPERCELMDLDFFHLRCRSWFRWRIILQIHQLHHDGFQVCCWVPCWRVLSVLAWRPSAKAVPRHETAKGKMTLSDLVQWSIGTTKFSLALKASYLARLLGFLAPRGCKIPGLSRPVWM